MATPGNRHCASGIGVLSFSLGSTFGLGGTVAQLSAVKLTEIIPSYKNENKNNDAKYTIIRFRCTPRLKCCNC